MDIRSLEIFLAVAESGNITRAAEVLGCSQPHVTRTVQDIEAELGVALLERAGRRIILSEAGLALEGEARHMLQAFSGLSGRIRNATSGDNRPLRIATTPAIGSTLLPQALARLDPELLPEIHVVQSPANTVAQQVRDGVTEIGFSSLPLDTPGVTLIKHYAAPATAALHKDDILAERKNLRLEDFRNRRLVTMLDPMRFQRHVNSAFAAHDIHTEKSIRTNAAMTALHLVRSLHAIALLDPVTSWFSELADLAIRPVDVEVLYHWGAVTETGRAIRPLAQTLIEQLEALALERIPGIKILDPVSQEISTTLSSQT